jgi:hypothetical protein
MTCYPEDLRDLAAIAGAWDVPMSTLCWSLVQDYLMRARGISSDLGEGRGALRLLLEVTLRDRELGDWLRSEVACRPQG